MQVQGLYGSGCNNGESTEKEHEEWKEEGHCCIVYDGLGLGGLSK